MKWYTHAIFAVVVGAIIGNLLDVNFTIRFFIITILSSLLIDCTEKTIFNEHKRQLHNLFMLMPCVLPYLFIDVTTGAGLTAGVSSHILLDCLTPIGCKLFWPIQKKRYGIRWKSPDNKAREKRILAAVSLLAILTLLILWPHGPFTSAIENWTGNRTGHNSTNSTAPDFRITINDPEKDMWIHPFPNGSVFIDVDDSQGDYCTVYRSYPVYYPVYNAPQSSNSSRVNDDGEEEA